MKNEKSRFLALFETFLLTFHSLRFRQFFVSLLQQEGRGIVGGCLLVFSMQNFLGSLDMFPDEVYALILFWGNDLARK